MNKKSMESESNYVTTRVAANMLNVSLRTVQLWVESGVLSAWKTPGGHRKVLTSSIEAVLLKRNQSLSTDENGLSNDKNEFYILLIEDDEGLRQLFTFYFTDWKYEVKLEVANNGFDGLISLGTKVPDLLITDLHMPGINGYDLLKHLSSSSLFNEIDIAVITAFAAEDIADNATFSSKIKVFYKPVDFDALDEFILPIISKKFAM